MTIDYQCPDCGAALKIKDRLAGTKGKCPKCKARFRVPEPDPKTRDDERERHAAPASEKVAAHAAGSKADRGPDDSDPFAPAGEPAGASAADNGRDSRSAAEAAAAASVAAAMLKGRDVEPPEAEPRKHRAKDWPEAAVDHRDDDDKKSAKLAEAAALGTLLVTRIIPGIVAIVLVFGGVYWLASSMYGAKRKLPELAQVTGTVTLDGEKLPNARLIFHPLREADDGGRARQVSSSVGRTDSEGRYTLTYLSGVQGAVIGQHMVEITAPDEKGSERIPVRYLKPIGHGGQPLMVEVKPGRSTVDLALTSDP